MKISKKIIFAIAIFLTATTVNAQSVIETEIKEKGYYINEKELKITKEIYDNSKEYLDEEEIKTMGKGMFRSIEQYGAIKGIETKYFKTHTYTDPTGKIFEGQIEISKEELLNANLTQSRATEHSTNYKTISIFKFEPIGIAIPVGSIVQWLKTPSTKSYDVYAMKSYWSSSVVYSFQALQSYKLNGVYDTIEYTWDSTNYKEFQNGAGISMNLVDNATNFELSLNLSLDCRTQSVLASYQHAQQNVTLAQSMNYTLSDNGYGGVILFGNETIRNFYDGMGGVSIPISCS